MLWNTDKINDIVELLRNGSNIKQIIRDININHILSDETTEIKFPFLISETEGIPIFRTPDLQFEYSEEEKLKMLEISEYAPQILNFFKIKKFHYQKDWLRYYQDNRFNLFVKSRQIGATTLSLICAIHYILTNTEKEIVFLCRDKLDVIDKFDKFIKLYNDNIPFYLQIGVTFIKGNKNFSISFENRCRISFRDKLTMTTSIDFLISEDINNLEPVIIPFCRDKILISSLPTKDSNSWIYKITNNQTLHKFNIQYFDWTLFKDRDSNWARNVIMELGNTKDFIQEYCCDRITPEIQSYLRDIKIDSIL